MGVRLMKTADFLAVTPSFSARALLAKSSCGEWVPRDAFALASYGLPMGRGREGVLPLTDNRFPMVEGAEKLPLFCRQGGSRGERGCKLVCLGVALVFFSENEYH